MKKVMPETRESALQKVSEGAIPDKILLKMISECAGDRTSILQKAKKYRQAHAHEILHARWFAEKGLLRAHGLLDGIKKANQNIRSEIKELIKTAQDLQTKLSKLPDFSDTFDVPPPSLGMHLEAYIYGVSDWEKDKEHEKTIADDKIRKWSDFLYLLEYHIAVFMDIQNDLSFVGKRGRPNTVKMLEGFVSHIAQMYSQCTGKEFTVGEYGDNELISEGVRFAQQAMAVLNTPANKSHEKYQDFLASNSYTFENIHNACDLYRRSLGKNQPEKP